LEENNRKLQEQVRQASNLIISSTQEGKGYLDRAKTLEEKLQDLTKTALRQGTVINGLKEQVEANERVRLEYQHLYEAGMEEIASLRLQIEEYRPKEQGRGRRISEAVQSVGIGEAIEEKIRGERAAQKEESRVIIFSEESLQRIRAIADKYRVRK